ncbi:aminotransferase class IV [Castellaniella sp.]|uniref:aminotransferase class IV n=1 Tax=Castellaniella sp. TaxID=1955812 RepID=UPI0035603C62
MIAGVDQDSVAFLNGAWLPLGEVRISALDRGFIFGDGVYDVVPAYGGQPFRMAHHLARLQRSLAAVRIETGRSTPAWQALVLELLARNPDIGDCTVYLQVTRGVARRDHGFPAGVAPTVFGMVSPLRRPTQDQRTRGLAVISIVDERWLHCEIKSTSLLGNVLARQQAVDAGVDEVVQFRDGFLTEGASCNIWVVKNGVLHAPLRNHLILEGVRYAFLVELAKQAGIPFEARPIGRDEVGLADELLLSSASKEVLPIITLDGRPVGTGRPGPVYGALRAGYDAAIDALVTVA